MPSSNCTLPQQVHAQRWVTIVTLYKQGPPSGCHCKPQGLVDSRAALDSVGSDSDASAASGFSPAVSPAVSPCLAGGHLVYRTPFFWQRVSDESRP